MVLLNQLLYIHNELVVVEEELDQLEVQKLVEMEQHLV